MVKSNLRILQMKENACSLFRHYGLPPLIARVYLVDRTIFELTDEFLEVFLMYVPHRFEVWHFNQNHGLSAIKGWRERRAKCSAQLIQHAHGVLEVDFDHWNPNHGVFSFIGHLVECIVPGKTDSFKILKALRKRGIAVKDMRREI